MGSSDASWRPTEDWRGAVGGNPGDIKHVVVPSYTTAAPKKKAGRARSQSSRTMSSCSSACRRIGSPTCRQVADDDGLLALMDQLPAEATEALFEVALGGKSRRGVAATPTADPFAHPDAQRRFRVMSSAEELQRALDFPWDKWTVFLHPEQRQWVERDYAGPGRVSGSAGTGKTIVALHRAVFLARKHPEARVLLTTFSETLASALRARLFRLVSGEPRLGGAHRRRRDR